MGEQQSIRDEIREAYVRPPSIFGGYGAEQRARSFDAWERRTRAEALRKFRAELIADQSERYGIIIPDVSEVVDGLDEAADRIENDGIS